MPRSESRNHYLPFLSPFTTGKVAYPSAYQSVHKRSTESDERLICSATRAAQYALLEVKLNPDSLRNDNYCTSIA